MARRKRGWRAANRSGKAPGNLEVVALVRIVRDLGHLKRVHVATGNRVAARGNQNRLSGTHT